MMSERGKRVGWQIYIYHPEGQYRLLATVALEG